MKAASFGTGATLIALLFGLSVAGGEGPRTQDLPEVMSLTVAVTGTDDLPVTDLEAEDFGILEGGARVEIGRFEGSEVPINVALVADASPVIDSNDGATRSLLKAVVGALGAEHAVMIVEAQTEVSVLGGLTSDRGELERAIDVLESTGRPTNHIVDATIESLVRLLDAGTPRAAVVVFTDGVDVGSASGWAQLEHAVRIAGVPVYVVAFDNVDGYSGNLGARVPALPTGNRTRRAVASLAESMERMYYDQRARWRNLAEESGGEFLEVGNEDQAMESVVLVTRRLHGAYTFYYYAVAEPDESGAVRIDVRVGREGVTVHAPPRLWSPAAEPN